MNAHSKQLFLHAYLEQDPSGDAASLMQYLTPTEKEALENLPPTYGDPLASENSNLATLSRIHASWISPFLRTLSEKEIGFFLASLEPSQAHLVGKNLLYSGPLPSVSPLGKEFLQQTLLGYLTAEIDDLLPLACLPHSPLNALLEVKNDVLLHSLDFLGLHDLSIEVRQIIEKQKLTKIYDALTPVQLTYLKNLLQSQEPVAFTRMGLTNWNEDPEKLQLLIRQRGANRLAKALYGQDPSLVWYLLHKLDVERALIVRKLYAPLENSRAVQHLIDQILAFITYTRQHHE